MADLRWGCGREPVAYDISEPVVCGFALQSNHFLGVHHVVKTYIRDYAGTWSVCRIGYLDDFRGNADLRWRIDRKRQLIAYRPAYQR